MVCFVLTPRCFAYRHAATSFYQLQRGFEGKRQHAWIQEFCQFYLVLCLFCSLQRESNCFIAEKTIRIRYRCTKDPEGSIIFQGGVQLFLGEGGPNANFYRNPYTYLLFSREGGGVQTPYPPLDPHMGNVIITGQYFSQSRF